MFGTNYFDIFLKLNNYFAHRFHLEEKLKTKIASISFLLLYSWFAISPISFGDLKLQSYFIFCLSAVGIKKRQIVELCIKKRTK